MPNISQIGFGTNDYPTIEAWVASAEATTDYGVGNPATAEVGAGTPALAANTQIRLFTGSHWPQGFQIRAVAGTEFDGNFGGSHSVLDGGGFTLDVRAPNGSISGLELLNLGTVATGTDYSNLLIDSCGIRETGSGINVYLHWAVTLPVRFLNTIIYTSNLTNNQSLYIDAATNVDVEGCTIIAANNTGSNGAVYVRGTLDINNSALFSTVLAYEESGTPTTSGDYNAGSDVSVIGANSVSTLTIADFVDYAANDFRIKNTSGLVGAGAGGGDIGAFVLTPSLQILTPPTELTREASAVFSIDSPNITLSTGNTTVVSTVTSTPLTVDSIVSTGGTGYDVTVTPPANTPLQHSSLGYTWNIVSGAESVTSELLPFLPTTGDGYTNLVDPSVLDGSVLEGYTGDLPVTGDQVVYDLTSAPSAIPFSVTATGEFVFDYAPTASQTVSRYVIQADGSVGTVGVATFTVIHTKTNLTTQTIDLNAWVAGSAGVIRGDDKTGAT